MLIHISHKIEFRVDPEKQSYGVNWHNLNNNDYEPDTIAFLGKYVDNNCIFLDCGAAVGAMSLVAASLGAKVIAYEPMEHIFELAQANVKLNSEMESQIEIKKVAVGNAEAFIEIIGKSERGVISEIVSQTRNFQDKPIKVVDLKREIESIKNQRIVMKIDIEGAEFKLLSDKELLSLLKSRKIICILALHPGFTRPIKGNKLRIIRQVVWKVRNLADCYFLFKSLKNYAIIKRSNEAIVDSALKFSLLSAAGVYEYILDFGFIR